jgi:hypothetical protein
MLRKLGYEAEADEHGTIQLAARKRYWRQFRLKAPSIAMSSAYWESKGYRSFKTSWSRSRLRTT